MEYFASVELSDLGRKRKNNEDACLRIPEKGVYCIADGMGGQAGGDLASEAITTALQETFAQAGPDDDRTFAGRIGLFRKAINQASKWMKNFADEKVLGQMGSTVVALVIDPRNPARAVGLHAGDSRLYRYRKGELKLLTSDHSAGAAIAAKLGRDIDSIPAKYQNELLRCVGSGESVELEKTPVDVSSGDLFLICSDGLTRMLPDNAIARILQREGQDSIGTVAQALIDGANEAGGRDNVSVVLVKVGDISGLPPVMDSEEEEEIVTDSPAGEAFTPPTHTAGTPDTDGPDQGHTPPTDDHTPDLTPDAVQPGIRPPSVAADREKAGTGRGVKIATGVVAALIVTAGAAGWLIFKSAGSPLSATVSAATPAASPGTNPEPKPETPIAVDAGKTKAIPAKEEPNFQLVFRPAAEAKAVPAESRDIVNAPEAPRATPAQTMASTPAQAVAQPPVAVVAAVASEAAAPKPTDAAQQANRATELLDLEEARQAFDAGDYDAVARLSGDHPGDEAFSALVKSSLAEQAALSHAAELFQSGDYSFTDRFWLEPYAHKPPFTRLLNAALSEYTKLNVLKTAKMENNWQSVLNQLADPRAAGLSGKPPFHALLLWANDQKEADHLEGAFETMLVSFGVKSPGNAYIKDPAARKARRINTPIVAAARNAYLGIVDQLESAFRKAGRLDEDSRSKYIAQLRDAINQHD